MTTLEALWQIVILHKYILLFLGILTTGDAALIPAVYGAWFGALSVPKVFFISVGTVLFSDSIWYLVGKTIPEEKITSLPFLSRFKNDIDHYHDIYKEHALKIVFLSKFLMGLRIPFQILAGINKLGYAKYMITTLSGSAIWTLLVTTIIGLTNLSLPEVESLTTHLQIFAVVFVVILSIAYWVKKAIQRQLE